MTQTTGNMQLDVLRALADTYMSVQKERIAGEGRLRAIQQGFDERESKRMGVMEIMSNLKTVETDLVKIMNRHLRGIPIYEEFLKHVKGIGNVLACKLLALPLEPERQLSSWNAYFGLVPVSYTGTCSDGHKLLYPKEPTSCSNIDLIRETQNGRSVITGRTPCHSPMTEIETVEGCKKKRGYRTFWNPKARTLYFLIAQSFSKTGRFYKEEYLTYRQGLSANVSSLTDGQTYFRALRHTFKLFLAHYYQATQELAGRQYRLPYAFEYLNHETFVSWQEVVRTDQQVT